jgi:hypothetical protein
MAGRTFLDAVEMLSDEGKARLRAYAHGRSQRALPGFLKPEDVYWDSIEDAPAFGRAIRVPLEDTGDPFGQLHDSYQVAGLTHRLQVFLPSLTQAGAEIEPSVRTEAINQVKLLLDEIGGGCTTTEGTGSWVDPIGGVMDERVHVLETYSSVVVNPTTMRAIVDLVAQRLDQHTVAVALDSFMYHIARQ